MSQPGFTAEISLRPRRANFRAPNSRNYQTNKGAVVPQLPVASGCGECTPLTWPNGTKTGACARACCDALGNCTTETCACGSGSGIFRGGWGSVLSGGSVLAF
jgi:hypothetical protein